VIPPSGHIAFVATLSGSPDCGAPFQLYVSSAGASFSRVGDATFAGSCAATPPRLLARPTLRGAPVVGRTLIASAATWSATPTRLTYRRQLCTKTLCAPIKGATRLTLKLTKRTAGHAVRIAAIATFAGGMVESDSKRIGIRR
jgi:hypothetical protein